MGIARGSSLVRAWIKVIPRMGPVNRKADGNATSGGTPSQRLPRAAYVHIPFCVHRCHYCDFAVVAGQEYRAEEYLTALEREMTQALGSQPDQSLGSHQNKALGLQPQGLGLRTLFLGGGTPTQLSAAQLERLFAFLARHLPWQADAEVSVEANPDGLTEAKIHALCHAGVNRISLGVQSFQPPLLRFLERTHTPEEAAGVLRQLLPRFRSVGVDLIFGVPGQTLEQWRADLRRVIDLGVPHVSTYGLTFEKDTPLWKKQASGLVLPLAEELEAEMYALAMDQLTAAGFEHYELSNFAFPGHRCRHNETYWANDAYWGFGLGAARFVDGERSTNTRSFENYLRACLAGADPTQNRERLPPNEAARETAMLNLRRASGLERTEFARRTGMAIDDLCGFAIRRHLGRGWLEDTGSHVRLTRAGKFVADRVIGDFLVT